MGILFLSDKEDNEVVSTRSMVRPGFNPYHREDNFLVASLTKNKGL